MVITGHKIPEWSRGHKARGQGHKKKSEAKDSLSEDRPLEAKEKDARGQGPRTQPQVFSKKRSSKKFFR